MNSTTTRHRLLNWNELNHHHTTSPELKWTQPPPTSPEVKRTETPRRNVSGTEINWNTTTQRGLNWNELKHHHTTSPELKWTETSPHNVSWTEISWNMSHVREPCPNTWSYGVTVSTLDSEFSDRGSNPRRTFSLLRSAYPRPQPSSLTISTLDQTIKLDQHNQI